MPSIRLYHAATDAYVDVEVNPLGLSPEYARAGWHEVPIDEPEPAPINAASTAADMPPAEPVSTDKEN